METYVSGTGQKLKVHDRAACSALKPSRPDDWCVIHKRKPGHMADWPTHWRAARFFEVLCPHGIGHPAPEGRRTDISMHGCDGCCKEPAPAGLYRYRIGGLMRCCTLTLAKEHVVYGGGPVDYTEGADMDCYFCSTRMVFRQGAWEQDKSRAPIHGWLAQRSFGEVVCLALVLGCIGVGLIEAWRGDGS